MTQMDPYKRGFRDAGRWTVTWLHAKAAEMNDPHARAILNTAAFHLGQDIAQHRVIRPAADQVDRAHE